MQRLFLAALAVVCLMVASAGPAAAGMSKTFGDNENFWPGWSNGDDDGEDIIGAPDLRGGFVTLGDNGRDLLSVGITYRRGQNPSWGSAYRHLLYPGDLFLDLGANSVWDYAVGTGSMDFEPSGQPYAAKVYQPGLSAGDTGGYNFSDGYIDVNVEDYRQEHPVSLVSGYEEIPGAVVSFSGFEVPGDGTSEHQMLWVFDAGLIDLSGVDALTVGFAVRCANDVIFETVSLTNPSPGEEVPVPAAVWLLGSGLLGLAGLRRKTGR